MTSVKASDALVVLSEHSLVQASPGARTCMTVPRSVWKKTGSCSISGQALAPDPLGLGTEALLAGAATCLDGSKPIRETRVGPMGPPAASVSCAAAAAARGVEGFLRLLG